jgi:O-antigen/teichoic acid export membrane protein
MSVGCTTFAALIALVCVLTWYKPWLLPRPSLLNRSVTRELIGSGSFFFLIQLSGLVVFSSDNLVVSHYLGAAEVTPYSVTWRLVGLASILQSLLFSALWPAYAEAHARGDLAWIRRTFSLVMKSTLAMNIAAALVALYFGRTVIAWWAGPAAVPGRYLLSAMCLWAVINGSMSVESCLLAALERTREQAVLSMFAALVNLTLSIVLVKRIGSVGVIAGTILSYLFVLVVPQSIIVRDVLRNSASRERSARMVPGYAFLAGNEEVTPPGMDWWRVPRQWRSPGHAQEQPRSGPAMRGPGRAEMP